MGKKPNPGHEQDPSALDVATGADLLREGRLRGREQAQALLWMLDDLLSREGAPTDYDSEVFRQGLLIVLVGFAEGLAERAVDTTGLELSEVDTALKAGVKSVEPMESSDGDDDGPDEVTEAELDEIAALAKSTGTRQSAEKGGVVWTVERSGDVGIGFLTPDQFGESRSDVDGDALAELYSHWYLDHLGPAVRTAAKWVQAQRAKGTPTHLFMFDAGAKTDKAWKPLDAVYAETSTHGVVASGAPARAVGAPITIQDHAGLTSYVGTVVAFEDENGDVVEQANVFAFPFDEYGNDSSVAELSGALAERLATDRKVPIVMTDPQALDICPNCRQLMCFGSTKQPEHAAVRLQ